MNKRIETVLENFIKNEIESTDNRIGAIRSFVDTLRSELIVFSANIPTEAADKRYFAMVLKLFRNMINTYDEEVQVLIKKREKMLEHLLHVRSVATHLRPADTNPANLHIN